MGEEQINVAWEYLAVDLPAAALGLPPNEWEVNSLATFLHQITSGGWQVQSLSVRPEGIRAELKRRSKKS